MSGKQRPTFDIRCRLEVEYSEVIADMNLIGITDHPETALWVKVTVTRTKSKHARSNAHQFSYTSILQMKTLT